MKIFRDSYFSRGRKLRDSMRRFRIKQPKIPMSQIILVELLISIVTATVVYTSAGTHRVGSVKAYIDPGTGSFVIQMIIASITGVVYLIKVFWSNIKEHFLKLIHKRKKD